MARLTQITSTPSGVRRSMRRVATTLAAAAIMPLAACQAAPTPESPRGADLVRSLPRADELPGRGWTLAGTTDTAPDVYGQRNPLADTQGAGPECRSALDALAASDAVRATGFAGAVYVGPDQADGRDLNLTLEARADATQRPAVIDAMTKACTTPLRTRAGDDDVTLRITPAHETTPGATGYTVTYDTLGVEDSFDLIDLPHGDVSITVSVTGPDSAKNRAVLRAAAAKAAAKLDAPHTG